VRTEAESGIQIGLPAGTPVLAAASGTVAAAGLEPCCARGRHVVIDHGGGFQTVYAHLADTRVTMGDRVQQGRPIGTSGRMRERGPTGLVFGLLRSSSAP